MLEVRASGQRSALLRLKEYPSEVSAAAVVAYVTRYRQVHELVSNRIDLASINPSLVRTWHCSLNATMYMR